ncbi:sigma 54-interacting transcriptional regulator [Ammoniphilus sp. YIM 78166]|uniref:sigma 54-interacting transcriptional regulator n=1 Tax=Ammoniphilus sp. YIM 78166 TaxID=1644106 RepID=UPI00106F90F4|nr:sigma 54-interacting transcriptional regulator [Ammoniphilus sp. YIM 78166]
MKTKILVITHRNFTQLVEQVFWDLHLPIELKILEARFGEVNRVIDLETIGEFDIVITSGAHLEYIKRELSELFYKITIYPLRFSESDLVKALVDAKAFSSKILLMYFNEENYDLEKYHRLLDIELIRLQHKDIREVNKLLMEYKGQGYHVVGTSSICELAEQNGYDCTLIYSAEMMKLELMKAYQLAAARSKMMHYAKLKDALFHYVPIPLYVLDENGIILDANAAALAYSQKRSKRELIGETINDFLQTRLTFGAEQAPGPDKVFIHSQKQIRETTVPMFTQMRLTGFLTLIESEGPVQGSSLSPKSPSMHSKYNFRDIVVQSSTMKKVIVKAQQYAQSSAPTLIYGESGTGKELIAHSIHRYSSKSTAPFVAVNCAAIPQNILESELFGYEEGSFTGAKKGGHIGFFELAQNGTIFLDEIGEIALETQTKLLRVLQEKELIRVGGRKVIPLDVRIITATNKSLPELIRKGLFREDLYYRINVLQINLPPLKDRKEDIPLIFSHLLLKYGMEPEQIDYLIQIGRSFLFSYSWPGNIREMENFVQRITALSSITHTTYEIAKYFKDAIHEYLDYQKMNKENQVAMELESNLKQEDNMGGSGSQVNYRDLEKKRILNYLLECNGNKLEAAKKLGISRTTLWRKMNELGI